MRRSLSSRLFAALFAPWFVMAVAEPVPMHDCPMHSLHPAAMQGMAAGGGGTTGHDAPSHPTHRQCCCLGACCAAASFDLARVPRFEWKSVDRHREEPQAAGALVALIAADHVLPFANGPPAAHA